MSDSFKNLCYHVLLGHINYENTNPLQFEHDETRRLRYNSDKSDKDQKIQLRSRKLKLTKITSETCDYV